ncbi:hypothetical protein V7201_04310 [Bacillus sp. JJ1122]|uniref:hypothetical protein n=1 Tax=Bacillus sp. JJ1122 TaxID=3122951 RepID=UPI002FFE2DCD
MERLGTLAEMFVEDVNKDDSAVLELFENILNFLYKFLLVAGIPFLLYVLLQFFNLY